MRETLYNWLNHLWHGQFAGRRILDLFAGTGALGLEAASRGAGTVHLVEADRGAAQSLQQSCARLKVANATVFNLDAASFLRQQTQPYDLILLDPPFGSDWLARLLPILATHVTPAGLLYVESDRPLAAPAPWHTRREGRAAAVYHGLLSLTATP